MLKCSECSKRVNIKSAASLFGVNTETVSLSVKAHKVNDLLIAELKKRHEAKKAFMMAFNKAMKPMFTINISDLYQAVSDNDMNQFNYSNIYQIQTCKSFSIVNSRYQTTYLSDCTNHIKVAMDYRNNVLSVHCYVSRRTGKDTDLFNDSIFSKEDFYRFISAMNNGLMDLGFKFSPTYDFTSTELDTIFSSCDLVKIKKYSLNVVDKIFDFTDIDKLVNIYLTCDKDTQAHIQRRLYNLF